MPKLNKIGIIKNKKRRKAYENDEKSEYRGGATLLSRFDAGFGGVVCEKTERNYVRKNLFPKTAFTLAEVLITLGIIGVVAAMTIPTLIANYQEKQTVSRLQKVYATLKNAFEMGKVEYGDYETWSWTQIPQEDSKRTQYFWQTYIFPYLKVTKECFPISEECLAEDLKGLNGNVVIHSVGADQKKGAFVLADGTYVYTWTGSDIYYPHVWVYADINGKSEPNVVGKDVFTMYFSPGNPGKSAGNNNDDDEFVDSGKTFNIGYGLKLYGEGSGYSAEEMMQPNFVIEDNPGVVQPYSCSIEGQGQVCGAVIQLSGWKIPDDYPLKF